MKKILVSVVIVCVALVVSLSIFTGKKRVEEVPAPSTIKEIRLYHYFSGTLSGGVSEMLDVVNAKDQSHRVIAQALDHEAFKSMIHATLSQGSPPELFTYWAGAKTQDLVDQKKLEPLDELWQTVPLSKRFSTSVAKKASRTDHPSEE